MNYIISVKIDRDSSISGNMLYKLTIEHLDESFSSIITELYFDVVFSSF